MFILISFQLFATPRETYLSVSFATPRKAYLSVSFGFRNLHPSIILTPSKSFPKWIILIISLIIDNISLLTPSKSSRWK